MMIAPTLGTYAFMQITRYLLLGYLDLTPTPHLQMPNCLTAFAYDQADALIGYSYNHGVGTGWPVRCQ